MPSCSSAGNAVKGIYSPPPSAPIPHPSPLTPSPLLFSSLINKHD
jgi:hypothetical protein